MTLLGKLFRPWGESITVSAATNADDEIDVGESDEGSEEKIQIACIKKEESIHHEIGHHYHHNSYFRNQHGCQLVLQNGTEKNKKSKREAEVKEKNNNRRNAQHCDYQSEKELLNGDSRDNDNSSNLPHEVGKVSTISNSRSSSCENREQLRRKLKRRRTVAITSEDETEIKEPRHSISNNNHRHRHHIHENIHQIKRDVPDEGSSMLVSSLSQSTPISSPSSTSSFLLPTHPSLPLSQQDVSSGQYSVDPLFLNSPAAINSLANLSRSELTAMGLLPSEPHHNVHKVKRQRPKRFHCPHCQVAFSNNGQLRGHIRIHTGERPFTCEQDGCGKSFTRNEELTRHRRIHSGLRPFPCTYCGKKFGRKDHLKKHTRTHQRPMVFSMGLGMGLGMNMASMNMSLGMGMEVIGAGESRNPFYNPFSSSIPSPSSSLLELTHHSHHHHHHHIPVPTTSISSPSVLVAQPSFGLPFVLNVPPPSRHNHHGHGTHF